MLASLFTPSSSVGSTNVVWLIAALMVVAVQAFSWAGIPVGALRSSAFDAPVLSDASFVPDGAYVVTIDGRRYRAVFTPEESGTAASQRGFSDARLDRVRF